MSMYDLPFFPSSGGTGDTGKDGISPTITVTEIDDGHRLTIVDVQGSKTVDIKDKLIPGTGILIDENNTISVNQTILETILATKEDLKVLKQEIEGTLTSILEEGY